MTKKRKNEAFIPEPIIVLDDLLPLDSLSWEQFESFCLDFVSALYEGSTIKHHKYGVKGSKQKGIDMFIDTKEKEHKTYQSKDYKDFKKGHIEKAIEDTSYKADSYTVLVASLVGTDVRDVCRDKEKWDVWDVDDICREIKSKLMPEKQRRLVVNHFGHKWVEKFLGIKSVSPFILSEDYFAKLNDATNLFHQAWDLVGRKDIIKELDSFVESDKFVFILEGRGGIGKTKILKEFSIGFEKKHPNFKLLFLQNELDVKVEDIKDLELKPHVIVIDDAHRRDDIGKIINLLSTFPKNIKFIFSTRPQGILPLRSIPIQNGCDPSKIVEKKVDTLSMEEARQLARQVLGNVHQILIDDLARQSRDCPLILVIGGKLISEKKINLKLLEQDDKFTMTALDRFRDVVLGEVDGGYDKEILKKIINTLAVIQPINSSDEKVIESISTFLSVDKVEIKNIIDSLEVNGVLIRRGHYIRISPDVLADHIVSKSCLTPLGKSNGFAQKVFKHFEETNFEEVLQNLGELDWRVSRSKGQINLLDDIWKKIKTDIENGDNVERCEILRKLNGVAYYQPEQTLKIIEYVINNPSKSHKNRKFLKTYGFSHEDCLQKLPSLLQKICYHIEYLPHASDLLWELGREDKRPTNQHPEHAIRILEDLTKYDIGKHVEVNKTMLESVKRWLLDSNVHKYSHSVFDIIDQLFEKSSHTNTYEGNKIIFHPFAVNKKNTETIRREALNIILEIAQKDILPVALRSIESISKVLSEPVAMFNRPISNEECKDWEDEQLEALKNLEKICKTRKESLIHISIRDDIIWYIHRSRNEKIRKASKRLFNILSKSFEVELTDCLMRTEGKEMLIDDVKRTFDERHEIRLKYQKVIVKKFLKKYPKAGDGFKKIEEIFQTFKACSINYNPIIFLNELSKLSPNYAIKLCDLIIKNKTFLFGYQMSALLWGIDETNHEKCSEIIKNAIKIKNENILISIADYYSYKFDLEKLNKQDVENIKSVLFSSCNYAKGLIFHVLGRLGKNNRKLAMELMGAVKLGKDEYVAKEYISQFEKKYGIDIDSLNKMEVKSILSKLENIEKIDDYEIENFLKYISQKFPEVFIDFLLNRVKVYDKKKEDSYQPFGHSLHKQISPLKNSKDYQKILRKIRDKACIDYVDNYWYLMLFKIISGNFNDISLKILEEWIDSGDSEKMKGVGNLVRHAYPDFVFNHPEFVEKILIASKRAGGDCQRSVGGSLFGNVVSRTKGGTIGQPTPEDIKMKNESKKLMEKYSPGHVAHDFYKNLLEYTEKEIDDDMKRAEEILES